MTVGNGAREAFRSLIAENKLVAVADYECATDLFLAELWIRGFKVVPLEAADGESSDSSKEGK